MNIDYLLTQLPNGSKVGYSMTEGWVIDEDGRVNCLTGKWLFRAVTLLQMDADYFTKEAEKFRSAHLAISPFPLAELLQAAFSSQSSFWAEKAAEWYPYLTGCGKTTSAERV